MRCKMALPFSDRYTSRVSPRYVTAIFMTALRIAGLVVGIMYLDGYWAPYWKKYPSVRDAQSETLRCFDEDENALMEKITPLNTYCFCLLSAAGLVGLW